MDFPFCKLDLLNISFFNYFTDINTDNIYKSVENKYVSVFFFIHKTKHNHCYVEKQIKTDNYPWALPCSFVVLVFIGLTYFAARFGQLKAKNEMLELRKFAEESTLPFEKDI